MHDNNDIIVAQGRNLTKEIFRPENIPAELKALKRWLLWRREMKSDGTEGKIPYNANADLYDEHKRASSTNPAHWATFEKAMSRLNEFPGEFSGLGFVAVEGSGIVGIDCDDIRGKPAWDAMLRLKTYAEITPSGEGLRFFGYGDLPFSGRKKGWLELYKDERFLTVTGNVIPGHEVIADISAEVAGLAKHHFPEPVKAPAAPAPELLLEDEDIVKLAGEHDKSGLFPALWEDDSKVLAGLYPSSDGNSVDYSRAHQALCVKLAFYSSDAEQIERLWRASGLSDHHKMNRPDYVANTIAKALDLQQAKYQPAEPRPDETAIASIVGEFPTEANAPAFEIVDPFIAATSTKKQKDEILSHEWAVEFAKDRGTHIVSADGLIYEYDGRRYTVMTGIGLEVRDFLIRRNARHSETLVANIVADLEAMTSRRMRRHKESMPCWIGEGEWPKEAIAFENGILNVDKLLKGEVELMPHNHLWASTACLPYKFDPAAKCPLWRETLEDVFDGDPERIALLQEWFGYCLVPDTSMQKLLVKYGPPRAFKGTSDKIQAAVLGGENTTGFNLHSLADKFGLGRLLNKQVAFISEVNLVGQERFRILEALNSIVGNDPQSIEEKYSNDYRSVRLPVRFSMSCNQLPQLPDSTGAISARMLILPFDKSFVGREDLDLEAKLLKELPGIFLWSVLGLKRLRTNRRFTAPQAADCVAYEARKDNSIGYAFACDCLKVSRKLDTGNLTGVEIVEPAPDLWVTKEALREAYQKWLTMDGREISFNWMMKDLKPLLPKLVWHKVQQDGKLIRKATGIALK